MQRLCRRSCRAALSRVPRVAGESHRVAVVDIGSNSTRLLIADVDGGRVSEVERQSRVTRLGRGVDFSGQLLDASDMI